MTDIEKQTYLWLVKEQTYLWLHDSTKRTVNGDKRRVWVFPNTPEHAVRAWNLVLDAEVPDERDEYTDLVCMKDNTRDSCRVLNDFWACYGWYMNIYDNPNPPDDCIVQTDEK